MAVIHRASLVPGKLELVDPWLARQPWGGGSGQLERVGSYRFDDPEGEVGIEGLFVTRGEAVFHVLLTYRDAPLAEAEGRLVGTMQHSVLGTRWVYDGAGDPVAVAALVRAARGEQAQAVLEVHDGDAVVGAVEPDVHVRAMASAERSASAPADAVAAETGAGDPATAGPEVVSDRPVCEVRFGGATLRMARVLGAGVEGADQLVADWQGGEATMAAVL
ncbi:hypothetical protein [Sinomonas sp. ASV322]|uniref:CG0192-related protein n=1 Tax=Sinomonas sp. ASV322 TaxID=3041920 RepID=UPI0027DB4585|nr:hypothetical protein [Sinomonas sp. ASV322]MDQ4502878.1 hypothetical protein [Sinomonas sp. ASV322]